MPSICQLLFYIAYTFVSFRIAEAVLPCMSMAMIREAKQEQRARHRDDEEERLRIETDARFRAAQDP